MWARVHLLKHNKFAVPLNCWPMGHKWPQAPRKACHAYTTMVFALWGVAWGEICSFHICQLQISQYFYRGQDILVMLRAHVAAGTGQHNNGLHYAIS